MEFAQTCTHHHWHSHSHVLTTGSSAASTKKEPLSGNKTTRTRHSAALHAREAAEDIAPWTATAVASGISSQYDEIIKTNPRSDHFALHNTWTEGNRGRIDPQLHRRPKLSGGSNLPAFQEMPPFSTYLLLAVLLVWWGIRDCHPVLAFFGCPLTCPASVPRQHGRDSEI